MNGGIAGKIHDFPMKNGDLMGFKDFFWGKSPVNGGLLWFNRENLVIMVGKYGTGIRLINEFTIR